jgi:hypothetical protein
VASPEAADQAVNGPGRDAELDGGPGERHQASGCARGACRSATASRRPPGRWGAGISVR